MDFYIKQYSELPILRMEIINDGRHDYYKFWDAIQAADITFTMINVNNGNVKISEAPCYIKLRENDSCEDQYVICYDWLKRDTKEKGRYEGSFSIKFSDDLSHESLEYPKGELIMPIAEKLFINII